MKRLLQYEPRDLTVSVESGMPFAELNALLARNGQMIPLEGPYCDSATVGGVVAANISGARRRLYGTARDLVIGMKFATLDGKLVQSGGMVVKNVAGLDMGKLMIGSFGTLAAIASVNFKLTPRPAVARTILFTFEDIPTALEARDAAIRGVLNPVAVEILNPVLSAQLGLKDFTLAIMFAGNEAVIERSVREASALGSARALAVEEEQRFWNSLHSVTPRFLEKFRDGGVVVRVSTTLAECGEALGERGRPRPRARGVRRGARMVHASGSGGALRGGCGEARMEGRRRIFSESARSGTDAVAGAGRRFCDHERDQAHVRSGKSSQSWTSLRPTLNPSARNARREIKRQTAAGRSGPLRALRPVSERLPHLSRARRRNGFAARPDLSDGAGCRRRSRSPIRTGNTSNSAWPAAAAKAPVLPACSTGDWWKRRAPKSRPTPSVRGSTRVVRDFVFRKLLPSRRGC